MGQAVGTAAALCAERGITPRELARRHDAQSPNCSRRCCATTRPSRACTNQDPLDLARAAKVTASAEAGAAKAALLLDGHLRDIPDKRGDPAEVHHWAAPVARRPPAWIELALGPSRSASREVQITFDTGFKRQLTLSAQETQNVNLLRAPAARDRQGLHRHRAHRRWQRANCSPP